MSILSDLRRAIHFERGAVSSGAVRTPPPTITPGGPGTELTKLFHQLGFDYTEGGHCACRKHAYQMDRLGPVWCQANLSVIVQWLRDEIDRRQHSLPEAEREHPSYGAKVIRFGLETLVKVAIWRATSKGATSRIYLIGYPGNMGGANTEARHLLKLWKRFGMEVHLVPTWSCAPETEADMTALGFHTHHFDRDHLHEVPGLAGSITVGMCNQHYTGVMGKLRELGCKIIWINCMTFLFAHERQAFTQYGCPDAMIYQSRFQQRVLSRGLLPYEHSPTPGYLIPGAFDPSDYPYYFFDRPDPQAPFHIGKLARPDNDKWPANLWALMEKVPHVVGFAMGCDAGTYLKTGVTPDWAYSYPPQYVPVRRFLANLHCLIAPNGGAAENWPRVGLEAMSAGVPLIVPNAWGWQEMITHGETGFLADNDEDYCKYATLLANDEPLRARIAQQARDHLVTNLANAEDHWSAWLRVFYQLYAQDEPPTDALGGVLAGFIHATLPP